MAERRHLPVIKDPPPEKNKAEEDDDEARPPWQWVGFGVVAIFAAWLPLAAAAGALARRASEAMFPPGATEADVARTLAAMSTGERMRFTASQALPQVLALALAAFAGGFLVGRFGQGTRPREAALAGGATTLMATLLTIRGLELGWVAALTIAVTAALAIGFAAWGGRVGNRRRDAD